MKKLRRKRKIIFIILCKKKYIVYVHKNFVESERGHRG